MAIYIEHQKNYGIWIHIKLQALYLFSYDIENNYCDISYNRCSIIQEPERRRELEKNKINFLEGTNNCSYL